MSARPLAQPLSLAAAQSLGAWRKGIDPETLPNRTLVYDSEDASTLDIDIDGVCAWRDKDGSGRDLEQVTPSREPDVVPFGIQCDNDDLMTSVSGMRLDQVLSLSAWTAVFLFQSPPATDPGSFLVDTAEGWWRIKFRDNGTTLQVLQFDVALVTQFVSTPILNDTKYVGAARFDGVNLSIKVASVGTFEDTPSADIHPSAAPASFTFFTDNFSETLQFEGITNYFVTFNDAKSDEDVKAMQQFLELRIS